jgi:hypothetical protein
MTAFPNPPIADDTPTGTIIRVEPKIGIRIVPPKTKLTRFEKFKMYAWNFLLPPQVRLEDWTKEDKI